MPKMQVYMPAELYERVQSRTDRVNVSGMLQDALAERLADLNDSTRDSPLPAGPRRRS